MCVIFPFEKCPCGSGKRYIGCCFKQNHIYQKISLPQGAKTKYKKIVIDKTLYIEYLEKINGFFDFHIQRNYQICMKDYPNLLYYIDKLSELYIPYIDCHKGCDYCCHMAVAVSEFEADFIKQYINSNWTTEQKENFSSKIQDLKKTHEEIFESDYILTDSKNQNRVPCIFLEKKCCSIYSARPAICRTYLSFSPSEICKEVQFGSNGMRNVEGDTANDFRDKLYDFYFSHSKYTYGHYHLAFWFRNF
ncbi:MAG: YkgJ family cysteine cluster protein [Oscillospiraceae bacterium]|nr:YkgJ family cysteine cluster protein [Oscillospiraceae bacterium]